MALGLALILSAAGLLVVVVLVWDRLLAHEESKQDAARQRMRTDRARMEAAMQVQAPRAAGMHSKRVS